MKKIILASFVVALLFLAAVGVGFSAGAIQVQKQNQPEKIESAGMGTIKGKITNQDGKSIGFVRIIAAGSPNDNGTKYAFTFTHIFFGKGTYLLPVPAGRYLFVRAGKLPLYIGAWAGPITVKEGQVVNLDLSITYIGPKTNPYVIPGIQNLMFERLFNLF
jgi:hypothetical protein